MRRTGRRDFQADCSRVSRRALELGAVSFTRRHFNAFSRRRDCLSMSQRSSPVTHFRHYRRRAAYAYAGRCFILRVDAFFVAPTTTRVVEAARGGRGEQAPRRAGEGRRGLVEMHITLLPPIIGQGDASGLAAD